MSTDDIPESVLASLAAYLLIRIQNYYEQNNKSDKPT